MLNSIRDGHYELSYFAHHDEINDTWKYTHLLLIKYGQENVFTNNLSETRKPKFTTRNEMLQHLKKLMHSAVQQLYLF